MAGVEQSKTADGMNYFLEGEGERGDFFVTLLSGAEEAKAEEPPEPGEPPRVPVALLTARKKDNDMTEEALRELGNALLRAANILLVRRLASR